MMDARQRLGAELLQPLLVDHDHARGAVADLARARRGQLAVLGDQLHALDAVEADVEADAFVDRVRIGRAVGTGDLYRHDLVLETARLRRRDRTQIGRASWRGRV